MENSELEKQVWSYFDSGKLIVGEIVNVDMFGESYGLLIFMYREEPKDKPTLLFAEYGAMLINTNEEAISKYMDKIIIALHNIDKI